MSYLQKALIKFCTDAIQYLIMSFNQFVFDFNFKWIINVKKVFIKSIHFKRMNEKRFMSLGNENH